MKKYSLYIIASILVVVIAIFVLWLPEKNNDQEKKSEDVSVKTENIPVKENLSVNFEQYPVKELFKGKSALLNLKSNLGGLEFKTVISDAYNDGINFADHYTIAEWGCGTDCTQLAVIDAINGNVYFFPYGLSTNKEVIIGAEEIEYKINSNLLIIHPMDPPDDLIENCNCWPLDTRYYKWENNKFILIYPKSLQYK